MCCAGLAFAATEPAAAGPVGGTDIRSAMLPTPGLYGGVVLLGIDTFDVVDAHGKTIPALKSAHLTKYLGGPFLFYVPEIKVLGGAIGMGGIVPAGGQCGRLFAVTPSDCLAGMGDPYVEIDWSRFFGTLRPSQFPGALPIREGLNVMASFGAVIPSGQYNASNTTTQALSVGANVWEFTPAVAVTYTTPPVLAEGTEISAKTYWLSYLENPATHYSIGDVLNVDFAVTEHIGRFQVGAAGFYAVQVEDNKLFGRAVLPDGRRAETLQLGGIVNVDLPEYSSSARVKVLSTMFAEDTVKAWDVVFKWIKKF